MVLTKKEKAVLRCESQRYWVSSYFCHWLFYLAMILKGFIEKNITLNVVAWKLGVIMCDALACNFIKKETLAQVLSCEFCKISKNTFFTEHVWVTASLNLKGDFNTFTKFLLFSRREPNQRSCSKFNIQAKKALSIDCVANLLIYKSSSSQMLYK